MQYTEISELNRALWYLDAGDAAVWEVGGPAVAPPDALGLYAGAGVDNSAVIELMRGSPPPSRVSALDPNVSVADARTPRVHGSGRRTPGVRDSRRLATPGSGSVGSASASAASKLPAQGVFGYTTSKLEFRKSAPTPVRGRGNDARAVGMGGGASRLTRVYFPVCTWAPTRACAAALVAVVPLCVRVHVCDRRRFRASPYQRRHPNRPPHQEKAARGSSRRPCARARAASAPSR